MFFPKKISPIRKEFPGNKKGVPGKAFLLLFTLICLVLLEKTERTVVGSRIPVFSHESGFYQEPFLLSIQAAEGLKVYYTLDCSVPTQDSILYEDPISVYDRSPEENRYRSIQNVRKDYLELEEKFGIEPVEKAFVVRAAAFDEEGRSSEVVTKTYFVGLEKYSGKTVISLVADPPDLFDPEKGIYVTGAKYDAWYESMMSGDAEGKKKPRTNYWKRGKEWEREADFTLFRDGLVEVSQPVGIRIQGNASRGYTLKRFSIYSRKDYSGSKWFEAPIFEEEKTHSVMTRNSFLNALSMELAKGRDVEVQPVMPVVMFLDGEFWYDDYFLLEKYSGAYFAKEYGLHEDNIRLIKTTMWKSVEEENKSLYRELLDFLEQNDLSEDVPYARFGEMVDLQSYIDYWCINLYLDNEDAGETLNVCLWRTGTPENDEKGDGRWRWALLDMDLTWLRKDREHNGEQAWEVDTFSLGDDRKSVTDCRDLARQPIYLALRKNASFKKQFAATFMDLVNTIFLPETVLRKIGDWENEDTDPLYREFFEKRAEYIVPCMAKELGLTGTKETVTLSINDPEAGTVMLNTITPDLAGGAWSGQYYTDFPVTLTAIPNPGYRFSYWQAGDQKAEGETAEFSLGEGGLSIHAVFEHF